MITAIQFSYCLIGLLFVWVSLATIATIKMFIELEAMKRSTHKVTFIDPTAEALKEFSEENEFATLTDDQKAALRKSQSGDLDIVA